MKKINRRIIFTCLLLNPALFSSRSQISDALVPAMEPAAHSPNAEAYQNINVDLYHGVAKVSIPLYEYRHKSISFPVSLNYTPPTKDSKSTYYPGWTGLGWSLSAGGVITRTVRGVADEKVKENGTTPVWPPSLPTNWAKCDPMEDEFTFNFCGYSGKFFFNKDHWIIYDTDVHIKLNCFYTGYAADNRKIKGFELTMPNGFLYTFGNCSGFYTNFDDDSAIEGTSAWYLSSIESPEGDIVGFNYGYNYTGSQKEYISRLLYNYTEYHSEYRNNNTVYEMYHKEIPERPSPTQPIDSFYIPIPRLGYASGSTSVSPVYLESITGGSVNIYFRRSAAIEKTYPANDLHDFGADSSVMKSYKLDAVELMDARISTEKCFKKYQLEYNQNLDEPLKLLSLREQGVKADNSVIDKPAYIFNYTMNDYWGFSYIDHDNTHREELSWAGKMELLQKITYPTGGYTMFEYVQNKIIDIVNNNQAFPNWRLKGQNSFRIKQMKSYGSANETPSITKCTYYGGALSRDKKEYSELWVNMPYDRYIISKKKTNYDQYSPWYRYVSTYRCIIPEPDIVGYGVVYVTKSKGSQSETTTYIYSNQPLSTGDISDSYWILSGANQHKPGKLLRVIVGISKDKIIDYDYRDSEWQTDTIEHKWIEYFPFKYYNEERTYVRRDSGVFHYNFHPAKPTKIIEYSGTTNDTICTTTIKYDRTSGNVLYKEIKDKSGDIYRTEYRYGDLALIAHNGGIVFNYPYETIVWKNGKVIAATINQDTVISRSRGHFCLPKKKFVLASATPLTNYQPADYYTRMPDARCKLVTTYSYDGWSAMPERIQHTGQEPVLFEWTIFGQPKLIIQGAEWSQVSNARNTNPIVNLSETLGIAEQVSQVQKLRKRLPNARITGYTYNLFGTTSVTAPTGYTQYTDYDVFGQPVLFKDDEGNILKSIRYNYNINP